MSQKENIRTILRKESMPIQIRRRIGKINRFVDDVIDNMYVCDYYDEDHFIDGVIFELGHLVNDEVFGLNDIEWMDIYEYIETYRTDDILEYFNERKEGCLDDLNESENKKYGLLRPIEENGLFQVMQDTGLSFQQIISKTGELSREVLERYIRDFINEEGYHQTNGDAVFYLSVVLSKDKIAETFYLSGDKVTVEVNEYGRYSVQIGGFVERLSNFTDEEIYMVVKGMIDWGNNSDLNESLTGITTTDTTQQLINKPVKLIGDVNTNTVIQNVIVNKDGSVNIAFKNGMKVNTSLPMLRTFNVGVNIPLEFKIKKKTIVKESTNEELEERIKKVLREGTNIKPALRNLINMLVDGLDGLDYAWAEYDCGMGVCCDPYAIGFVKQTSEYNDYTFKLVDGDKYDIYGDYPEEFIDELPEVCYHSPDLENPNFNTIILYEELYRGIEDYFGSVKKWGSSLLDLINEKYNSRATRIIFI
jgi:hypothetical protein